MKSAKRGDMVLVHWDDIHEKSEWDSQEHPEPSVVNVQSVGWVSRWGKLVVLVRTYGTWPDKSRQAGDSMTIPRGCITKVEILRAHE